MVGRISENSQRVPLLIDFDAYTDGDEEFKKELVALMIENLIELRQISCLASMQNDTLRFRKVCHKVEATLQILNDRPLLDTIELLKTAITVPAWVATLSNRCTDIIDSLQKELQ